MVRSFVAPFLSPEEIEIESAARMENFESRFQMRMLLSSSEITLPILSVCSQKTLGGKRRVV